MWRIFQNVAVLSNVENIVDLKNVAKTFKKKEEIILKNANIAEPTDMVELSKCCSAV